MRSKLNDFYVYIHRKKSDGAVFYVGKGCKERSHSAKGRNKYWKRIVAKHGFCVEFVATGLQDWYAMEVEIETILKHGRENLCNMTDGGDGASGHIKSAETIEKSRAACTGQKRSEETKRRQSAAATGRQMSKESVEKTASALRGRKHSPEQIERAASKNRGKKRTQEQIRRLSESLKGMKKTPEWIEKIAATKRKPVVCVTTGAVFDGIRLAVRWLAENGFPKASMKSVWKAASEPHRVAYGFKWAFRDDHWDDRIKAEKRNGKYRGG